MKQGKQVQESFNEMLEGLIGCGESLQDAKKGVPDRGILRPGSLGESGPTKHAFRHASRDPLFLGTL